MNKTFVRIMLVVVLLVPPSAIYVVYRIAKKEQAAKLATWEGIEPAAVPRVTDEAKIIAGGYAYQQHCGTCHGPDGQGGLGKALNHAGLAGEPGHAYLMTVLANGIPNTPMVPWKGVLSPDEAAAVAAHVQTFVPAAPAEPEAAE